MSTSVLEVQVRERADGSREVSRNIESVGTSAQGAEGSVRLLRRALGLLGGAAIIRGITRSADAFVDLESRIATVVRGTGELSGATQELFAVSRDTRQAMSDTVGMFARLSGATQSLGLTTKDNIDLQRTLNQIMTLNAGDSSRVAMSFRQLFRAMEEGNFSASVLIRSFQEIPVLAETMESQLGKTRQELIQMAQDGQLAGRDIVEAIQGAREEIADRFAEETIPTLGEAFVVLKDSITEFVGGLNSAVPVMQGAAQTIMFIGRNLGPLTLGLTTAVAVWKAKTIATVAATVAMKAFNLAVRANPIGLIATGAGLAVGGLTALISSLRSTGSGISEVASEIDRVNRAIDKNRQVVEENAKTQEEAADVLQAVLDRATPLRAEQRKLQEELIPLRKEYQRLNAITRAYDENNADAIKRLGGFTGSIRDVETQMGRLEFAIESIKFELEQGVTDTFKKDIEEVRRPAQQLIETLERDITLLQASQDERESLAVAMDLERQAREKNTEVAQGEIDKAVRLTEQKQMLIRTERESAESAAQEQRQREQWMGLVEQSVPATDRLTAAREGLADLVERDTISQAQANRTLQQYAIRLGELQDPMERMRKLEQDATQFRQGVITAQQRYNEQLAHTNDLLRRGLITQEEARRGLEMYHQELVRGHGFFGTFQQQMLTGQQAAAQFTTAGIGQLGNALGEMATQGKTDVRQMVNAMIADLARLAVQMLAVRTIMAFASPHLSSPAMAAFASSGGSNMFGFQHGGSFHVGGSGGPDTQLVQFMATPGERVTVETRDQQRDSDSGGSGGGGDITVVNASTEEEAAAAMSIALNSKSGEKAFLNHARRNLPLLKRLMDGR